MINCVFCKIISGEIPSHKIYEDNLCLAFLDINPVVPGHVLLSPKAHHEMMTDTPAELLSYLFPQAKELMIKIKDGLGCDFVTLTVVGTDIPHLHIHLIPRSFDDGLVGWPTQKYAAGEADEIINKLSLQ